MTIQNPPPREFMFWRLLRPLIILPGTVLVLIPGIILYGSKKSSLAANPAGPDIALFWLGLVAAAIGITLAAWTVSLFTRFGRGTPAPWDPPQTLVILGPYRYVRNPMITGALLILTAETLLFRSWPLCAWEALFFLANAVYFPLVEEKGLEKKFGNPYRQYKKEVPRWIPRLHPWIPPGEKKNCNEL